MCQHALRPFQALSDLGSGPGMPWSDLVQVIGHCAVAPVNGLNFHIPNSGAWHCRANDELESPNQWRKYVTCLQISKLVVRSRLFALKGEPAAMSDQPDSVVAVRCCRGAVRQYLRRRCAPLQPGWRCSVTSRQCPGRALGPLPTVSVYFGRSRNTRAAAAAARARRAAAGGRVARARRRLSVHHCRCSLHWRRPQHCRGLPE